MTREFVYTALFQRSWKAMGLNDADQKLLEEALLQNPQLGDVIEGTGGARKCGFIWKDVTNQAEAALYTWMFLSWRSCIFYLPIQKTFRII